MYANKSQKVTSASQARQDTGYIYNCRGSRTRIDSIQLHGQHWTSHLDISINANLSTVRIHIEMEISSLLRSLPAYRDDHEIAVTQHNTTRHTGLQSHRRRLLLLMHSTGKNGYATETHTLSLLQDGAAAARPSVPLFSSTCDL